ncbi:MAG: four helix bundle protein [Thiohalospira sp.]
MDFDDFRNMSVWQKSAEIVVRVYEITKSFPTEEKFGLVSDMRRAANSISHNIAEACLPARQGYGRFEVKDKTRFYKISRGSAFELMSQSFISEMLKYMTSEETKDIVTRCKDVIKELNSLIKSLEKTIN